MSQIMLCENWHLAKSFSPFEDISASRGEYVRSGRPSKKSSSPHPPDQLNQSTTLTTNVKLIFKEVNRTPEEEKWCKIWSWHLSKSVLKTTINASQSGTRPHRFAVLVHQQQWTRSQWTTLQYVWGKDQYQYYKDCKFTNIFFTIGLDFKYFYMSLLSLFSQRSHVSRSHLMATDGQTAGQLTRAPKEQKNLFSLSNSEMLSGT